MSEVPYGVLLSGGLDSSLIASIASRLYKSEQTFGKILNSYCIGFKGSKDIEAAKVVADFIGTKHYSFEIEYQEALDMIPQLICSTETFEQSTVRSGTPMLLLARKIKAHGIKMIMSGEGSDEIFGGYM